MSALFTKRVIHRDMKPDNILVHYPNFSDQVTDEDIKNMDLLTEPFVIKIADLGYSRSLEEG